MGVDATDNPVTSEPTATRCHLSPLPEAVADRRPVRGRLLLRLPSEADVYRLLLPERG